MKKKLAAVTVLLMAGAIMTGCSGSSNIETEDITITGYKGIEVAEVEKPEEVTDEDVENQINAELQTNAEETEITDRPAQDGDIVNINFVGKMDGQEFEGGSAENTPLEIGSGSMIEGFEESIVGRSIGETFDWNGKFPDPYTSKPEYAGKDVVFTITVNSISEKNVPELNDEYVKTVSDKSKTVKQYKKEVKKNLETQAQSDYDDQLNTEVWQAVMEKTKVKKYPKDEVKKISDSLIDQYKSAAEYSGQDYETFLKEQMNATVEDFEKQVEKAAKSSVKQIMATEAIADKEKIELTDDVYEKELKKMAKAYGYQDVKTLKQAAEEKELKEMALNNLVREWLTDNCVQVADKSAE